MSPHLPKRFTHFTYLSYSGGQVEPTGMVDLSAASVATRRKLVHQLITNGELLKVLPENGITSMKELRGVLGLSNGT